MRNAFSQPRSQRSHPRSHLAWHVAQRWRDWVKVFGYSTSLTLCSLAIGVTNAAAQRLSGSVHDSASNEPISGAVVSLIDVSGHSLSRVITDANGRFRLVVAPTVTRLQVVRIGFRPVNRALAVGPDADTTMTVAMAPLPTMLGPVSVVDHGRCSPRPDRASAFGLWEQARAALLASIVARETGNGAMRVYIYDRTLDADGNIVKSQSVKDSAFVAAQDVVAGRAANQFAVLGYTEELSDGRRYYAPDAEGLLDSAFVEDHCFELRVDATSHVNQIGLAFAPAVGNAAPVDISGVLWLDSVHPALRSLDFTFTGLEQAALQVRSGGELVFREMANGVVVTERWNLHAPTLAQKRIIRIESGRPPTRIQTEVTSLHDIGGELAAASWPDGTRWQAKLATIVGRVTSADDGHPLKGVAVRLDRTPFLVYTDNAGRFEFPNILPGPYIVAAADPVFGDLRPAQTTVPAMLLQRGESVEVAISLPSPAVTIAKVCRTDSRASHGNDGANERLIIGEVASANGLPAGVVQFRAAWSPARAGSKEVLHTVTGQSDSTGTFMVCEAPANVPVALSVSRESFATRDTIVTLETHRTVAEVAFELARPGSTMLPAYRRRILGVFDDSSGRPVAGVEVLDASTDRLLGLTSSTGTASLAALDRGPSLLRLRKSEYPQRIVMVNVSPADSAPVTVSLRGPVQTSNMNATTPGEIAAASWGFDERRRLSVGRYLGTEELLKAGGTSLNQMLIPLGLAAVRVGLRQVLVAGERTEPCPVTVYVDGKLYYEQTRAIRLGSLPPDFGKLHAEEFVGAEYYRSAVQAPIQYSMMSDNCGILLLWTRD